MSDGWRHVELGDLLSETGERAVGRVDLPVLSITKTRGVMLAADRFKKAIHGRDLSKYRIARRGQLAVDPMLLWDGSLGLQRVAAAGLVSPDYRVFDVSAHADADFIEALLRSEVMRPSFQLGARGTNVRRNRVGRGDFLAMRAQVPSLVEQRRIAAVLRAIDQHLATAQAVARRAQVALAALRVELLEGGLPNRHAEFRASGLGEAPSSWVPTPLGVIAERVRASVDVEPTVEYREIGVRSHGRGVFHKPPVRGSELGNKKVYWVEPNCIVFNIVFAWEGAVAATAEAERGMIASHRFPMLRPDPEVLDLRFGRLVLQSAPAVRRLGALSPGGAGRNRTLNLGALLAMEIPVPSLEEQRAIATVVSAVEGRVSAAERLVEALRATRAAVGRLLLAPPDSEPP
jgi:type I restriction enzyme S subunit